MAASGSKPHPPSCFNPSTSTTIPPPIPLSQEEDALSRASHITYEELLRRRLHHSRQLKKCYKGYYWALMEELKIKYREYYWQYGVDPFKESEHNNTDGGDAAAAEGTDENNNGGASAAVATIARADFDAKRKLRCSYSGCKTKAMALTSFCHLHILSDRKQRLYKPCSYVIKSAQAGPITCGKPILRSTVPSLCTLHFQTAQKSVKRALKKAGLNMSSSSKLAPKFHVIVAEYVRQIQAKRRAAQRANGKKVAIKEEIAD